MLCRDCPLRENCQSPCPSLEKELTSLECYQRELIVTPGKLEHLAEANIHRFDPTIVQSKAIPAVQAFLELLSSQQREAIELYFFDNISIPKIAEILNINRSSVQRRIRRGLKALKQMLGDQVSS